MRMVPMSCGPCRRSVFLGALSAVGKLPVSEKAIRKAIETKTKKAFLETNLLCFDLGAAAAKAG